jgi:hypothetical protein
MRKVFDRERHVGVLQEFLVLVAVQIEGRGDEGIWPDGPADPPCQLGLRPRHAAYTHGAVQAEIDAVERAVGLDPGNHLADESLKGLFGDPSRSGAGPWPQRRFDSDQFHAAKFPRHLHKAAHIGFRIGSQQRLAPGRRPRIDEVVEGGVVLQERHGLVRKMQHGDTDGTAGHLRLGLCWHPFPHTGITADLAPTAHSDFARQTCNKACDTCLATQRILQVSCPE